MTKDKAVFWITRRIRAIESECAEPDQEAMARHGLSYGARREMVDAAKTKIESLKNELESLKYAVEVIEKQTT